MPRQMFRSPKRSVALRARVVSALLMHRANMRRQIARLAERSGAVGARVVLALLVHRAHVQIALAWTGEGAIAARASVRALAFLCLLHHGCLGRDLLSGSV
jgi:hypothetical protein